VALATTRPLAVDLGPSAQGRGRRQPPEDDQGSEAEDAETEDAETDRASPGCGIFAIFSARAVRFG
jgi:hypothetical protein